MSAEGGKSLFRWKEAGAPMELSVHVQDLPLLLQKVWSHAHSKASGFKEHFKPTFRVLYLSPYAFATSQPCLNRGSRVWPLFVTGKWKSLFTFWAEEFLYHEQIPEDVAVQMPTASNTKKSPGGKNKTAPVGEEPESLLGKTGVIDLEGAVSYFKKIKALNLASWQALNLYVQRTPQSQGPSCIETAWELTLAFVNSHCPSFFLWAVFSQAGMEEFMYLHTSVSAERVWRFVGQKPSLQFARVQEASALAFFTNPLDEREGTDKGDLSSLSGRSWRVGLHAEEGGWLEAGDGRHDELFPGFLTPHTFSQLGEGWRRALLRSLDDDSRHLVFVYWWLQAWCLCTQATGLPEMFPNFDNHNVEGRFCFLPFLQLASKLSVPASADHGPTVLFSSLYQQRSGNLYLPVQTEAARKTIAQCFKTLVELGVVRRTEVQDDTSSRTTLVYQPTHFARVEEELSALAQRLEEELKPCKYWTRFVRTHSQLVSRLPNAAPFSEEQLDAQAFLARHPLAVLDGCAGSGKSTVAASLAGGVLPTGVVSITKTAARALTEKVSASTSLLSAAPREDIRNLLALREAAGSVCPDPCCPCVALRQAASSHLRQSLSTSKKRTTKKKTNLRGFDSSGKVMAVPFTQTVEWLIVKARFAAPALPSLSPAPSLLQERSKKRQKTGEEKVEIGKDEAGELHTRAYCLLVDEAETISLFKGLRLLRAVLKLAKKPAFLLFLGDPQQTAAIGVGNLQAFLKDELPTVTLSQSFRFKTNFVMKTLCAWFSSSEATPTSPSQVLPSLSRGALARVFLDRPDPSFFEQRFFHFLRTAPPSPFLSPSTGPGAFQVITFRNEERRRANEWGYRFELARRMQAKWSAYLQLPTKKRPLFLGLSVVVRCSPWLAPPDSLCVLEEGTAATQHRHESSQASRPAKWVPRPEEAEAIPGTQGVVVGLFLVRVLVAQRKVSAAKNEQGSSSSSSSSTTSRSASAPQDSETASGGQRKLLLITTYAQVEASCVIPTSLYSQKPRPRGKHAKGTTGCAPDVTDAYKGFWLKVVLDTGKKSEAGSSVCEEVFVDPNDPFQGGDCLQLAYALSVPAVTGLQYRKAVTWVSPKPFSPMHLHSRKLVYTGLSRNVVGPPEVWRCVEGQTSSASRRLATEGDSKVAYGRYPRSEEEWVHAFRATLRFKTRREREDHFKGRSSLVPLVDRSERLAWDLHRNL